MLLEKLEINLEWPRDEENLFAVEKVPGGQETGGMISRI